ncbi:hypothetical protein PPROV_000840500 [Pycnococcus provasolii]|uniref:Uncharacterized protein n=1 Tax=Pycnococcus provasolii TaxID=41880 RepID=A0A830HV95_9CHLO|nr:hypothetical protein PPROV_000840500 [Pycnococcus provasolii]
MAVQGGEWKVDLFSCGDGDTTVCAAAACCPCIILGAVDKVAEPCDGMGGPCMIYFIASGMGLGACYACTIRSNVRSKYGIPGGGMGDFCTHACCDPCALCQEYGHTKKMLTGGK